jgi:hypothetical protein
MAEPKMVDEKEVRKPQSKHRHNDKVCTNYNSPSVAFISLVRELAQINQCENFAQDN